MIFVEFLGDGVCGPTGLSKPGGGDGRRQSNFDFREIFFLIFPAREKYFPAIRFQFFFCARKICKQFPEYFFRISFTVS